MLREYRYNREDAVSYAHRWAFGRNPAYSDFEEMGGDCANFASQCIYAGAPVMNYTPIYGWYYESLKSRSASWSGVDYLYKFLTSNTGEGPFGKDEGIAYINKGDIIQLKFTDSFKHTLVVVDVKSRTPNGILIASHSYDADYRKLSSYSYADLRTVCIKGFRKI